MAVKDMVGLTFGKLTVLKRDETKQTAAAYWICQCECGNQKSIRGDRLRNGEAVNCGCEKKERPKDITSILNQKFGRLTVIERDLTKPSGHQKESYWKCICDCGKEVSVTKKSLINGKTKSCGCYRSEVTTKKNTLDLTNKRYGKLIALENTFELTKHRSYIWKCLCDCGNICYHSAEELQSNKVGSCGCKLISKGEYIIQSLLNDNNISFSREFTFPDLKNPKTNVALRYDFALFENNQLIKLIEFDGEQHFKDKSDFFRDTLEEIQQRDVIKNNYALNKKIPLIRIPYWELENLTIEDLLSNKFSI